MRARRAEVTMEDSSIVVLPETKRAVQPSNVAPADRTDIARNDLEFAANPLSVVSENDGPEPEWTLIDQIAADRKTSSRTEIVAIDTEPSSEPTPDAAIHPRSETVSRKEHASVSLVDRPLPFPGPEDVPIGTTAPLRQSPSEDVPAARSCKPKESVLATAPAVSLDQDDGWKPFDTTRDLVGQFSASRQPAFVTRNTPFTPIGREVSPTLSAERSVGTVTLQITRQAPPKVCAHQVFHDEVSVQNNGAEVLDTVLVEQTIPPDCRLVDTNPRAFFDHEVVRWRLSGLKPGANHICRVALIARQSGAVRSPVRIRALAAASMQTHVDEPHIGFKVNVPNTPFAGKVCPITFQIDNVGRVEVDNIALHTDLPAELSYHYGRTLRYEVGTLKVGESHTAHLTAQANRSGDVAILSRLLIDGVVVQETTNTLHVRKWAILSSWSGSGLGWDQWSNGPAL